MCNAKKVQGGETLRDAFDQLMSASSALHMYDELDPEWSQHREPVAFLDEKYAWGKHCRQHLSAGIHMLVNLMNKENKLTEKEMMLDRREQRLKDREHELMEEVAKFEATQMGQTLICANSMEV